VRIGDIATTADVMRHLTNLALVRHTGTTIQLHRLVHALLRARVRAAGEDVASCLAAHQLLATAEPDDPYDPSTWPVYAMLTPHVQAISEHASRHTDIGGPFRVLTLNVLRYLHASGQYVDQRLLAGRTRQHWIDTLGADHADTLRVATNLATALFELREFEDARDIGQDVLERTRRVMGVDHPAALSSATNLAQILTELGEYTAACEIGQDTVERFRRVVGPDHLYTLGASDNLVSGLYKLGDYKAARELGEDTYQRTRGVLGPDHPHTLGSATNLVMTLTELGDHEAARDLGLDTLERTSRILGPDHPHTRRCATNLAALNIPDGTS
jgi:tetratricopeptide (TPR) repeat protein